MRTHVNKLLLLVATGTSAIPASSGLAARTLRGYTLQEAIHVPRNGSVVTTGKQLRRGVTYVLRASGTLSFSQDHYGDAGYLFAANDRSPVDNCKGARGPVAVGVWVGSRGRTHFSRLDWGRFRPDHRYRVREVGIGARLSFTYRACSSGGTGSNRQRGGGAALQLEVLRPTSR
jgi:hypothetical protein